MSSVSTISPRTKVRSTTIVLLLVTSVAICNRSSSTSILHSLLLPVQHTSSSSSAAQHHAVGKRKSRMGQESSAVVLALKDAAPFPIGTVWSSGHATWYNLNKGTDLGGPSDVFEPGTFITESGKDSSTIVRKQIDETAEHEVLLAQFNSITSEVALKPHNVAAAGPNDLDFAESDAMIAFAQANNLRVHGHTLVYHHSIPQWALEYEKDNTWTAEQWEDWLQTYIKTVVGRYKGTIASWDVLNEPANSSGEPYRTDSMFWWRVIGPSYIENAFRWAAEADPAAKLFINDYSMDHEPQKLRNVLDLAKDLRELGVKVDGIGLQGHITRGFFNGGYNEHRRAYETVSNEGYLVHISELDVGVNRVGFFHGRQNFFQHWIQRRAYNNVARAYRDGVAPQNQWGITLWNIADPNSFYNIIQQFFDLRFFGGPEYPLLWDAGYNPKPAYYSFRKGLQGIVDGWFF